MPEFITTPLPPMQARALLRHLRDLNLSSGLIATGGGRSCALAGCLSLDAPVESGVRYRLRHADGGEERLEIAWDGTGLSLSRDGAGNGLRELRVDMTRDPAGRACAARIGARIDPESADPRLLERFLRRVVRALAG